MPTPLSMIDKVLLVLSGTSLMNNSGCASSLLLSVKLSNLILSNAYTNPKSPPLVPSKSRNQTKNSKTETERTYIRGIADKFTKKDFLVGIERVDDQAQELVDLCLECKGLCFSHFYVCHYLHTHTDKASKKARKPETKLEKDF
jgi:hypothetical protein